MKRRIGLLFKLYLVLLLIFLLQKVVFMLVNAPYAAGVPFGQCVAVLWHGLRLDSVTASYLLVLPWLVLLISCFVKKMPLRPILAPYYVVVALIISFLFSADVIMYHFWGAKFDANDFIYAANPKDLFASVHWWTIPLGIAAIGLIAWLYAWCLLKITPRTMQRIDNKWLSLLFLLVGGILFLGMRGGVSQSTANPSYAYFSKYAFCNHSALNPTFNIFHSLFKTEDLEHEFNYMSDSEAQAIVAPCFADDGEILDTLLNVSRPDILMIVWEGGGWDMTMNDSVGPNITRYAADGVLFNNCYANNFRTDRGLVSILNGWPGLPTTSLMKMGAICGRLPSLAHTLQDEGYATSFVYGGDIDFTNMCGYLLETGFEKVSGKEVFGKNARLSSWGAPDAYTLLPLVIARNSAKNKPRFDVLLTLSSHEPWIVPVRMLDDDRKNSFAYTDSCLGVLLDSLKSMPLWDNLLIVIVPDHGVPLSGTQSTGDYTVSHIPMVWTGGAVREHKVVDALMNQSDIAATLLAQMQLDGRDYIFSRNILSCKYAEKYKFATHCFKNGCNLIDGRGVTRFDCADCSTTVVTGEHSDQESSFVKAMIQYVYKKTGELNRKL